MHQLVRLGRLVLVCGAVAAVLLRPALGTVIDFTGGTVFLNGGGTQTTNNSVVWEDVDYYEQNGFRLDFTGNTIAFSAIVGDYYEAGNDVIHGHWSTGNFGDLMSVVITQIGGGAFDLNYFILTSNTDTGGSTASGNEQTYIRAVGGAFNGYTQLLPPEDWGFPGQQIFLGPQFDAVTAVEFFAGNPVDCFGMDEFFINQAPPVPEPSTSTLLLLSLVITGTGLCRRRLT